MKISVFYQHICEAAEQTGRPLEDILSEVRGMGIQYIEADLDDILRDDDYVARLKRAGFNISSVYAFYDLVHDNSRGRMTQHIQKAAEADCGRIMIIPGFYSSEDIAVREDEREKMLRGMREICGLAEKKCIVPMIEDFDSAASPIADAEGMLWFLERIPSLRVAFDTGNFMYSAKSETEAFQMLRDKTVHVHCKDRCLDIKQNCGSTTAVDGRTLYPAAVGDGCIKMAEIVDVLESSGFDGIYAIEHFGADDQLKYIKESAEWLKGRAK